MWRRTLIPFLLIVLFWTAPAWAVGPLFTGTCDTISWNPNQEPDLASYKIYDRSNPNVGPTFLLSVGLQITSVPCSQFNFNPGQHYISVSAVDTSGNESALSPDFPFVIVSNNVQDLRITAVTATGFTLDFTEVDGGNGLPASYDVRYAAGAIAWGQASSVSAGTCTSPVSGTSIGATKSCTVTGLALTTDYQFQLVPFHGTLEVDAVFGPLSNVAAATTGGSVPGATGRVLLVLDDFESYADGPLPTPPWIMGFAGNNNLERLGGNVTQLGTNQAAMAIYNPITISFAPEQWAELRVDSFSAGGLETLQVGVRLQNTPATGLNGYTCLIRHGGTYTSAIRRYTNNNSDNLVTENATTWLDGVDDTFRCEVHTVETGEKIDLYRNTDVLPLLTYTDTTRAYTSGQPGPVINNAPAAGDNFRAGIFQAAASGDACGCDQH
jgi:hypothetical protein